MNVTDAYAAARNARADASKSVEDALDALSSSADDFERIWSDETWWRDAE
jgi:hypothetical protein